MKKKLIIRFLLIMTLPIAFNSCRTDEVTQEEKRTEREKIEAFKRFENNLVTQKALQKNSSEYISYHQPFNEIIQAFMSNNPSYAQRFHDEVGDIYFDLRSVTYGETTKGLAYPIMKNGAVNAVLIGVVNPERDWVNFTVLKNNSPEALSMISKFQNFYNSPSIASKGKEQMQEEQIEEVVITVYQGIPGPSYTYYVPWFTDYVGSGGSVGLGGGMSGGGGSYTGTNNNIPDPCLKQKSQTSDPTYKTKAEYLKTKTNDTYEQGFRVGNPVAGSGQTGAQYQQLSNYPGTNYINFSYFNTTIGMMHSHYDGLYPMFSPEDIILYNQLLLNAKNNNIPLSDVFLTVVTSQGNYQLRYVGISVDALPSYTQDDIKALNKTYQDDYLGNSGNQQKYEEGFLKFMKDKMNVSGVKLYQNKDNGNAELTLNSNNKLNTPTPCP